MADPPDLSYLPGVPERVLEHINRMNEEALKDAKALGFSSAELECQRAKGERTLRTLEGIFERKAAPRLN